MELLVKPEIYIHMDLRLAMLKALFPFAAQCFNTESVQKVILWHIVRKPFAATKVTLITDGI
jgi:hypothetical protein